MKNDPLNRIFPPDLSDEAVDTLCEFLTQLNDIFFDVYAEQFRRITEREALDRLDEPLEPPFDDDIPW